eukprot:1148183-Pelagomonas_calceolata.AAC.6
MDFFPDPSWMRALAGAVVTWHQSQLRGEELYTVVPWAMPWSLIKPLVKPLLGPLGAPVLK